MQRRSVRLALTAVSAVLVVSCSGSEPAADPVASPADETPADATATDGAGDSVEDPAASEAMTSDGAMPPLPTIAALDFSARRLGGGTVDGMTYAGGDVVLWMWAPWCPQCNREAPAVAAAAAEFGDRVSIIGVPGHDSDDAHAAFVEEHGLADLVHAIDDDGSLWAQYGISYQPAWVFINQDGEMTVHAGGLYDELEARLQALVDA